MDGLSSQADMASLRTFIAQVHGRQDTLLLHACVCCFASEPLVVRPLTSVASRLEPLRIVSLTFPRIKW